MTYHVIIRNIISYPFVFSSKKQNKCTWSWKHQKALDINWKPVFSRILTLFLLSARITFLKYRANVAQNNWTFTDFWQECEVQNECTKNIMHNVYHQHQLTCWPRSSSMTLYSSSRADCGAWLWKTFMVWTYSLGSRYSREPMCWPTLMKAPPFLLHISRNRSAERWWTWRHVFVKNSYQTYVPVSYTHLRAHETA